MEIIRTFTSEIKIKRDEKNYILILNQFFTFLM